MTGLPPEYLIRMKNLLEKEFDSYVECLSLPAFRGIRRNPLKCGAAKLIASLPFSVIPTPFSPFEYYIPSDAEKIGRLPMHHAGAFYVQEPSASSAVTALDPQPGEKILDLCAAPGGKSTQIASLLNGSGLLWSNEVVHSRAVTLLSNVERMGVQNAVVSCCRPDTLCHKLSGYFDRVLVDAPCSGEGMFRRSAQAVRDWSPEHVRACAERQSAILQSAAEAVKENGILTYSTCTFSKDEDEDVVSDFLLKRPDFELLDCRLSGGRPAMIRQARRIYPMDGGEGHFVAVFHRLSPNSCMMGSYLPPKCEELDAAIDLFQRIFRIPLKRRITKVKDCFFLLPDLLPRFDGPGVIRAGILLGRLRNGRVEPEHALFSAAKPEWLYNVIDLAHNSPEIAAFLRGEEITVSDRLHGYVGVAVDGVSVGFGKCSGGRMKNHYPKGLRNF